MNHREAAATLLVRLRLLPPSTSRLVWPQVTIAGASVKINQANVIKANIQASNGIIHEVDSVSAGVVLLGGGWRGAAATARSTAA